MIQQLVQKKLLHNDIAREKLIKAKACTWMTKRVNRNLYEVTIILLMKIRTVVLTHTRTSDKTRNKCYSRKQLKVSRMKSSAIFTAWNPAIKRNLPPPEPFPYVISSITSFCSFILPHKKMNDFCIASYKYGNGYVYILLKQFERQVGQVENICL